MRNAWIKIILELKIVGDNIKLNLINTVCDDAQFLSLVS